MPVCKNAPGCGAISSIGREILGQYESAKILSRSYWERHGGRGVLSALTPSSRLQLSEFVASSLSCLAWLDYRISYSQVCLDNRWPQTWFSTDRLCGMDVSSLLRHVTARWCHQSATLRCSRVAESTLTVCARNECFGRPHRVERVLKVRERMAPST